jgi:Imm-5 like putative immunity protein
MCDRMMTVRGERSNWRAPGRGEIRMTPARTAAGHANGAARDLSCAAREAAHAAGQAGAVAHVAAHELGAAAYAIRAARAAVPDSERDAAGRRECRWQRSRLPTAVPSHPRSPGTRHGSG